MNRYLEVVNKIKQKVSVNWLMPSQRKIFDIISNQYMSQKMINVFGRVGSGKTLLGWVLNLEEVASYLTEPDAPPSGKYKDSLVIDNVPSDKFIARSLRLLLFDLPEVSRVIILTEKPVEDSMPKIELRLNEEDLSKFKQNMFLNCGLQITSSDDSYNLSKLIISSIIVEGE